MATSSMALHTSEVGLLVGAHSSGNGSSMLVHFPIVIEVGMLVHYRLVMSPARWMSCRKDTVQLCGVAVEFLDKLYSLYPQSATEFGMRERIVCV